jgi:hypothetical protein
VPGLRGRLLPRARVVRLVQRTRRDRRLTRVHQVRSTRLPLETLHRNVRRNQLLQRCCGSGMHPMTSFRWLTAIRIAAVSKLQTFRWRRCSSQMRFRTQDTPRCSTILILARLCGRARRCCGVSPQSSPYATVASDKKAAPNIAALAAGSAGHSRAQVTVHQ